MQIENDSSVNKMPLNIAKERLPYVILKILNGAEVIYPFEKKNDAVCIKFDEVNEILHKSDFLNCKTVADYLYNYWILAKNITTSYSTLKHSIDLHYQAYKKISEIYEKKFKDKKRIIFIKGDDGGCGYWRMILPVRQLSNADYIIDVSKSQVIYEYLLEYDVIVIQRTCDWNSYYIIEKLKKMGKKIIYDIDDNMFDIPEHHPSYKYFENDERESASSIMLLSDKISVTTERLKQALIDHVGEEIKDKIFVIPNAIDVSQFEKSKSLDISKPFRVLWSGGASHEYDFDVCSKALTKFFTDHRDSKLTIIGYLPSFIRNNFQFWQGVAEYVPFKNVETYFSMLPNLYADIGICPLIYNTFNMSKSPIKWIEYTMANLPVIASNCPPYSDVIVNGVNGRLANNEDEWYNIIHNKYDNREDLRWKNMVVNAKNIINENYNIKNETIINKWIELLN